MEDSIPLPVPRCGDRGDRGDRFDDARGDRFGDARGECDEDESCCNSFCFLDRPRTGESTREPISTELSGRVRRPTVARGDDVIDCIGENVEAVPV